MWALNFESGFAPEVIEVPLPEPPAGEVRIRVQLAGVCETDLQLVQGYMGFSGILGHEFVGIAETGRYAGQRVVGEINCCQEDCCREDPEHRSHCPRRTVLGILNRAGAFAEWVTLPEANLHLVPDAVENERAVFVEPLAAAFQILEQLEITPGLPTLVLGDGRLGYLCAQVLAQAGAYVQVVGKHADKLARFQQQGLPTCLLEDIPEPLFQDRTTELVVDCTGSPSGLPLALQLVKPCGTVVMKTTVAGEQTLALAPIVIDEIRLLGSRCGPFPRAIRALEANQIEVLSLITSRYPLSQAVQALQTAMQQDQHKVLIDMAGDLS